MEPVVVVAIVAMAAVVAAELVRLFEEAMLLLASCLADPADW